MKQPSSLLKTAVVLSAVLLVGAFVSCRAGASWFKKANTPPQQAPPDAAQEDPAVLGGSKSATVMSGSKSGVVLPDSGLDSSVWDLDTSLVSDAGEPASPETTEVQSPPPPR